MIKDNPSNLNPARRLNKISEALMRKKSKGQHFFSADEVKSALKSSSK